MDTKWYGRIGSVEIKNGFDDNRPTDMPKYLFIEVINFQYKNEQEIAEFCTTKKLYLSNYPSRPLTEAFETERLPLKNAAELLYKKDYNRSLIEEINSHLEGIKNKVKVEDESKLHNLNAKKTLLESRNNKYLISIKSYANSFSPLWEALVNHFIEKQDVRMCRNCGNFFLLKSMRSSAKWCSSSCKNSYSHKKRYHESKPSK